VIAALPPSRPVRRPGLIRHAPIAGVLATGVAPAVQRQAAVRWRLARSFPESRHHLRRVEFFAKHIKTGSGGKFEVSLHAAGELASAFGAVYPVQEGTMEAAHAAPSIILDKDETIAVDGANRFGLNSDRCAPKPFSASA